MRKTCELLEQILIESGNAKPEYFNEILQQQKISGINLIKDKIGQILKYIGILNDRQIRNTLKAQKNTSKRFGEILVEQNLIQPRFLNDIINAVNGDSQAVDRLTDKKLGEILVDLNYIESSSLDSLLIEQQSKEKNKRIGTLISEKGLLSFSKISKVLKMQKKLASLTMVTLVSTSVLAGCKTPRVSSVGTLSDYSDTTANTYSSPDSTILKVLKNKPTGSVNYYKDGTIAISNIPFYQQGNNNTCGQAVMTSILNFWGIGVDYQTVVNQTNAANLFTDVDKITSYLRRNGLYAQDYRQATLSFVKDRVLKGWPVIILLDFGKLSSEHYVVVTGYNDEEQKLILMDPIDGPNIKMDYSEVEQRWENRSLKNVGLFGDKYSRIVFDISGNE